MMIQEIAYVEEMRAYSTKGSIIIEVMNPPSVRYVRRVEKIRLDFIGKTCFKSLFRNCLIFSTS